MTSGWSTSSGCNGGGARLVSIDSAPLKALWVWCNIKLCCSSKSNIFLSTCKDKDGNGVQMTSWYYFTLQFGSSHCHVINDDLNLLMLMTSKLQVHSWPSVLGRWSRIDTKYFRGTLSEWKQTLQKREQFLYLAEQAKLYYCYTIPWWNHRKPFLCGYLINVSTQTEKKTKRERNVRKLQDFTLWFSLHNTI